MLLENLHRDVSKSEGTTLLSIWRDAERISGNADKGCCRGRTCSGPAD